MKKCRSAFASRKCGTARKHCKRTKLLHFTGGHRSCQKELAVNDGFAVLANQDVLNEALADDCQGLEFSFDRVKLPAGGGTAFEIPSADGEDSEMAKDITGVIVYNHPAYYHDKYNGGSNPPDCGSFDGVSGIGNPGGSCQNCPYNKFGSGDG